MASVTLCVCVCVRTLNGIRLELSTPTLVHVYSLTVARHALTRRSKGKTSRSHGYENRHGRTAIPVVVYLLLPVVCCCDCYSAAAGVGLHVV